MEGDERENKWDSKLIADIETSMLISLRSEDT